MLTKKQLRYKVLQGFVHPTFISPTQQLQYTSVADDLIAIFKNGVGKTEEQLEEEASLHLKSPRSKLIADGFFKLLLDNSTFMDLEKAELENFRDSVFGASSEILKSLSPDSQISLQDYKTLIRKKLIDKGLDTRSLEDTLYCDLPMYRRMTEFSPISSHSLIQRYNTAQVQGLLIQADKMVLTVFETNKAILRQLFRCIRFFQLLGEIKIIVENHYEIVIAGPLSQFFQTSKYGLRFASFFPYVLHLSHWQLDAPVFLEGKRASILKLNSHLGLKSHYQNFNYHEPEEIKMFKDNFLKKCEFWELNDSSDFVSLGNEYYSFPDFVIKPKNENAEGKKVYLEFFHPWHEKALIQRLEQLEKRKLSGFDFLLAASKKVTEKQEIKSLLSRSDYFQNYGIIFREIPTTEQIIEKLNRIHNL